jgi:hypothetical protein
MHQFFSVFIAFLNESGQIEFFEKFLSSRTWTLSSIIPFLWRFRAFKLLNQCEKFKFLKNFINIHLNIAWFMWICTIFTRFWGGSLHFWGGSLHFCMISLVFEVIHFIFALEHFIFAWISSNLHWIHSFFHWITSKLSSKSLQLMKFH